MSFFDSGGGGGIANTSNLDVQESNLDMGSHLIRNLQTPVTNNDAASKVYVDTVASTPGPAGPGGEAGAVTLGSPRNATTAIYHLTPVSPELVGVSSEYNWTNGDTITIDGVTYTFVDAIDETYPTLTITATDQVSDGDTVTVGGLTYRFKNVLAQSYDILIGANANESMTNLRDGIGQINGSTMWIDGTIANPDIYGYDYSHNQGGAPVITDGSFHPIARTIGTAGNALNIPISTTSSVIEFSSPTFTGGTTNSQPNQVFISQQENGWFASTMYGLMYAVSGVGAGFGITGIMYSSGTDPNPRFSSGNSLPMDLTARQLGATYNDLEVTMSRNDMVTFSQDTIGYDATPASKGDIRVDVRDDGVLQMYVASADINTTTSQAWRVALFGPF